MKIIKFYTLGCKVNQYETEEMREQFINAGFKDADGSEKADLYVVNTCTVTHRADSQSFNLIRRARRENPKSLIIVTGCLAELDQEKILAVEPGAMIIKNKDKERISSRIFHRYDQFRPSSRSKIKKSGEQISINQGHRRMNAMISFFKGHTRAFLKIQDGCNNYCSYCKVPLVRGSSRSRKLAEIIKEAEGLVENGFQEIVISGICLGAYGKDLNPKADVVDVIEKLEEIPGLLRIRLSSIEASDITQRLIGKIANSKKLCRHLHIPIQSGDDRILKKMNRKYNRNGYLGLIRGIKKKVPGIAITTDVLIGFPGEDEDNFQNTVGLIRDILPLKVHIFPYSPRKGTSAINYFNQAVDCKSVEKRGDILGKVARDCALEYRKRFLGRKLDVLIEGKVKNKPDYWQGYSSNYIKVLVKSRLDLKNKLLTLKLKRLVDDYVLSGEPVIEDGYTFV